MVGEFRRYLAPYGLQDRAAATAVDGGRLEFPDASRSALSNSVAGLEAKLNMQIFVRTTRNVLLIAAGARFAETLSSALVQLEQAVSTPG